MIKEKRLQLEGKELDERQFSYFQAYVSEYGTLAWYRIERKQTMFSLKRIIQYKPEDRKKMEKIFTACGV